MLIRTCQSQLLFTLMPYTLESVYFVLEFLLTCPCNVTFDPTEVVGIYNLNLLAILVAAAVPSYGIQTSMCMHVKADFFLLF